MRRSLGEIWNFTKFKEERHRKLSKDTIPISELHFVCPEWGRNPDVLLGSLGFKESRSREWLQGDAFFWNGLTFDWKIPHDLGLLKTMLVIVHDHICIVADPCHALLAFQ